MTSADIAVWVQAASTIVLVIITAWYAVHTKRIAEHSARSLQPRLIGRISPYGWNYVDYEVANVSQTSALNVRLELRFGDRTTVWLYPLLAPGERERFYLPVEEGRAGSDSLPVLAESGASLDANLSYTDAAGATYQSRESVAFPDIARTWTSSRWQQPEIVTIKDLNDTLSKGLDSIRDEIRRYGRTNGDPES